MSHNVKISVAQSNMLNLNVDFTKKKRIPKRFKEYAKLQEEERQHNRIRDEFKKGK